MVMSPETKAAMSEKMKQRWAERKAKKADPALQEAMAKVPMTHPDPHVPAESKPYTAETPMPTYIPDSTHIDVQVDWEHMPMGEAQQFYAYLKDEFEKAGKILNIRSMARISGYTCFMCHKHFNGNPAFTDHSYVDPKTGLSPRVDCCGELCVINYNAMRINQRHERDVIRAEQERG